jgi:hypothetical protein
MKKMNKKGRKRMVKMRNTQTYRGYPLNVNANRENNRVNECERESARERRESARERFRRM